MKRYDSHSLLIQVKTSKFELMIIHDCNFCAVTCGQIYSLKALGPGHIDVGSINRNSILEEYYNANIHFLYCEYCMHNVCGYFVFNGMRKFWMYILDLYSQVFITMAAHVNLLKLITEKNNKFDLPC